jgi:glutamyl-tRNA reductase
VKLFVAGISHKTAPVELRERLAVQRSEVVDIARTVKLLGHLDEIVLLSTCNRVEIYGTTRQTDSDIKSLLQLLCSEPRDLEPHIYLYEEADAVRHLLRVAAGLDSMVLGETEITGQIKNAYETAREAELTGPVLNRLFQKAFQTTKEIRTRTAIGRGTVSIKSTAVELIGKTDLSQQSIMVLGAGAMAESCVRLLVKQGARSIFISSRSFDRAIDLSVPRNIDPAAGELENISLYNIDDLEAMARHGVQARERELAACHQIIDAHVAALTEKLNAAGERLSVEERNNRWIPDRFGTSSNLLPTAA